MKLYRVLSLVTVVALAALGVVLGAATAGQSGDPPDLSASTKQANRSTLVAGESVTYTLRLTNSGGPLAGLVRLSDTVPAGLAYIPNSLAASSGAVDDAHAPLLRWSGALTPTPAVTITYAATVIYGIGSASPPLPHVITNTASVATSGYTTTSLTTAITVVAATQPGRIYLPLLLKGQSSAPQSQPPQIAGCNVFPADNIWNTPIDTLPVDANSAAYVNTIGANRGLHPDFGTFWEGSPIGIPFMVVPADQAMIPVQFTESGDESDPGPCPIPLDAPIEGGSGSDGDRHVLVIRSGECKLYELYYAFPGGNAWEAGSGAVYALTTNGPLRPAGWTSADAAGLPILPGLVRYDEVMVEGEIRHAVRFTAPQTRRAYVWPARHYASSLAGAQYPPMGQRFRLKAGFNLSGYSPQIQVILRALKKYGMILADNGSAWYISGEHDPRWDDELLGELKQLRGSDFEAVDESSLMIDADSGQARQPSR